ncbi:MAG: ketoacyl-ACP synthase III [Proteobacteria bacterium]|nr:ketoacyl-ACP synthase III [Pseudomonadota bacterium]MDA0993883.1 ketoacyl-ACP synthase III [Pseudomonadota bacterium]
MIYSRIAGTGRYLPERILTNADLEKMVDTSDEWIRSRTGIEQRHVAGENELTSDLCVNAAKVAIEEAGITVEDIDLIVVGTTSPDLIFPNIATIIQHKMGIPACAAFSIEAACTGFIYALSSADKFIRSGDTKCALVIGAEIITKLIDWDDRSTCVLFGDGAGAVVLQPSDEQGIISTHLGADGQYKDLLYYPVGVSSNLAAAGTGDSRIMMSGNEVFKVAVKTLSAVAQEALDANGLSLEDVDWLIPHQANLRIIQATAKRLDMPMEKIIQTVQIHGNTSAASVPMALDVGIRDGRIRRGQTLLLEAFGGGFTWGSVLLKY